MIEVLQMKALVLFSGGVDSTTCLALAIEKYGRDEVLALSVGYGQKHSRELEAAQAIVRFYGVSHRMLDIMIICSLTSLKFSERGRDSIVT